MNVLLEEELVTGVTEKEILFRTLLHHPKIEAVRSRGLMMAVVFDSFETNKKVIDACIEKGVITDWFLFAEDKIRIAPPLSITMDELNEAVNKIKLSIDEAIASN